MISKNRTLSENCKSVCGILGYDIPNDVNAEEMPSSYLHEGTLSYEKVYFFVLEKLELKEESRYEELFEKFQRRYENFAGQRRNAADLAMFFFDWYRNVRKEGFSAAEYFYYELFCKEREERKTFLSNKDRLTLKNMNKRLKFSYLTNRALFNEHFVDYISREWVNCVTRGKKEMLDFIERHPKYFVKASSPNYKFRPSIIDSSQYSENLLFELMHYKGLLAETIIEQHEELAEIYPTSLNTLRMVVQSDGQIVKVKGASASFGNEGDVFDTFSRTGLAASVDIYSGKINSPLVDKFNNVYDKHPVSNTPIRGMEYPEWGKICDVVCRAMQEFPEFVNIGWDVAVRKDGGVELLGAVTGNNFSTMQMPNQKGIRQRYADMLE